MLLRRGSTASAVLSIALLVAVIASTASIANHLSLQAQALSSLVNPGGTIIILDKNAASLSDSMISAEQAWIIVGKLENMSCVKHAAIQKILTAKIASQTRNVTAQVRLVEDVAAFLKMRNARLNGTAAASVAEANMGEILAGLLSVKAGDEVTIGEARLRISGVFRSQTEIDSAIIAHMQLLKNLTGSWEATLIELILTGNSKIDEALNQITKILPENLKAVQIQQPLEFAGQTIRQTLNFLNAWFAAIYLAVAAASYVIAGRLIAESNYEFSMLKTLGAGRSQLSTLIILYILVVAASGAALGTALGTVGAQSFSSILRWMNPAVDVMPFLEPIQVIQTSLLTLAASLLGCIYPAIKIRGALL